MHYVDKWLEGDELEQDEVIRAKTMREKTLQIVEQQQAEIEKLNVVSQGMKDTAEQFKEELEILKAKRSELGKEAIQFIRSQAIKEFVEKLKYKICEPYDYSGEYIKGTIDNLINEMTEG